MADAIRDLQQRVISSGLYSGPTPVIAIWRAGWGSACSSLGTALRESDRQVEALASLQESQRVVEAIIDPRPGDVYNLVGHSQLSLLSRARGEPSPKRSERVALADRAMEALCPPLAAGFSDFLWMDRDKDLDPLRSPADFKAFMLDRGFPLELFAGATAHRGPAAAAGTCTDPRTTAPTRGGK